MNFFFDTKGSIIEHNTDAPVFAVKAGEIGYYPIYTHANAEKLNHGAPADVLEAALAGSMFGWNIPAADAARAYIAEKAKSSS